MTKKWNVQNISKEDMDNHSSTTKLEYELDRLSKEGWNIHTVLDNYSYKHDSRKHVTIICWKDVSITVA